MRITLTITIILLAFSSACSPNEKPSELDADAMGRHIIGPAVSIPGETPVNAPDEVIASLRLTREKAWRIFGQIVADQDIAVRMPTGEVQTAKIPRFLSWYSLEDANRLFSFGLDTLSAEAKDAGVPVNEELWAASERKLLDELKGLPKPLQKKWENFFADGAGLTRETLMGASGLSRTLFNSELLGAVAKQYAALQDCYPDQGKPAFDQGFVSCFPDKLPASSMMMKTNWLNTSSGFRHYATNAEALLPVMNSPEASWDDLRKDGPVPENIVKATQNGKSFVLGGMHIVSKEFEDWIWISAWWSETPDEDFGEDRPDFIRELGAPWNQYKICAVSSFAQDATELDAIAQTHPSLAAAYRAVLNASGASWCSNPYIEKGVNNQKTNCIGCHQFAGTEVSQSDIISDPSKFPHFGNTKQRLDFPSDYVWSATQGQISWLATFNSLRFPVQ